MVGRNSAMKCRYWYYRQSPSGGDGMVKVDVEESIFPCMEGRSAPGGDCGLDEQLNDCGSK